MKKNNKKQTKQPVLIAVVILVVTALFGVLLLHMFGNKNSDIVSNMNLSLIYTEKESSEDSHTITETFSIQEASLKYQFKYDGFHPNPNYQREKAATKELTADQQTEISQLVSQLNSSEALPNQAAATNEVVESWQLQSNDPAINLSYSSGRSAYQSLKNYPTLSMIRAKLLEIVNPAPV